MEKAEREKEAAHQHAMEQARSLASAQARADAERQRAEEQLRLTHRARLLTIIIAIVGLAAVGIASVAIYQRQELVCDARVGYVFVPAWRRTFSAIGCPTALEQILSNPNTPNYYGASEERFEKGYMFWRNDLLHIYVLENNGTWRDYPDTRNGQDSPYDRNLDIQPCDRNHEVPGNLVQPVLGFYKVWRENLGGPNGDIGWATECEHALALQVQDFDRALMLFSDRLGVFILYKNGRWEKA